MALRKMTLGFLASFLPACGDTSHETTQALDCLTSADCGGNIEGTWMLQNACPTVHGSQPLGTCSGSLQKVDRVQASGTIDFHGGTSQWNVMDSLDVSFQMPVACASKGCDAIGIAAQASASEDVDSATVLCTMEASMCICGLSTSDTDQATRQYTVSGNSVSFVGIPTTLGYCVASEHLLLRGPTETWLFSRTAP